MNWNMCIRQIHRWLSIAFTVAVIVNVIAMMQEKQAVWPIGVVPARTATCAHRASHVPRCRMPHQMARAAGHQRTGMTQWPQARHRDESRRKAGPAFRRQSSDRQGRGRRPRAGLYRGDAGLEKRCRRRLDALIVHTVPNVRKAVKWNSPFYGVEGDGWFLSFHCFTRYVKVAFFRGMSLRPVPPGESKSRDTRYLDIHEHDKIDETQFADWVKQASRLPGERM